MPPANDGSMAIAALNNLSASVIRMFDAALAASEYRRYASSDLDDTFATLRTSRASSKPTASRISDCELIDERKHVGAAHGLGCEDTAGREIFNLSINTNLGTRVEDAADDDGTGAGAARNVSSFRSVQ